MVRPPVVSSWAYTLYNAATAIAAPFGRAWLWSHPAQRPLLQRFQPAVPVELTAPIWVHACSVGEVNTALPLLDALRGVYPDRHLVMSASTRTGMERALASRKNWDVVWCPFDTTGAVRGFLRHLRPAALVLIETELWPNLVRETARAGAPVIIVNGRLSDKHHARYQRYGGFYRHVLRYVVAAGMQSSVYVDRLLALGVDQTRACVTGNLKFDAVTVAVPPKQRERLRRECGFAPDDPVLVFGSSRPGDEVLARDTFRLLQRECPQLRLVVAPRHLDRVAEIRPLFSEPVLLRSAVSKGTLPQGERVVIVDALGELVSFYSIATVAAVGGSFFPGVNGHNPLEPAALGTPTVFGPYMANFAEPAAVLLEAQGALRVARPEDLAPLLSALLRDPAERRQLGTRGRKAVLDNQGAVQRNLALIRETLEQWEPR